MLLLSGFWCHSPSLFEWLLLLGSWWHKVDTGVSRPVNIVYRSYCITVLVGTMHQTTKIGSQGSIDSCQKVLLYIVFILYPFPYWIIRNFFVR